MWYNVRMKNFHTSSSSNETMKFAETLAKKLSKPEIILLSGDLGAGKTTFAKGLAKGLGIKNNITSPTFTILNEYTEGKLPLYHFDMYRLTSAEDAYALGFETYFNQKNLPGIVIVEWAENVDGLIKKPYLKINFIKEDENNRKIVIEEIKWIYYV